LAENRQFLITFVSVKSRLGNYIYDIELQ